MTQYAQFHWSDSFSVGILEIDNQHKTLIELINRIFLAALHREHWSSISEILDILVDYTRTHFLLEEKLMRAASYAGLAEHQQEHRLFVEKIESVSRKFVTEDKVVTFELINFLKRWMKEHILETDMAYAKVIAQSGFSTDQWAVHARTVVAQKADEHTRRPWWKFWRQPIGQLG